MKSSQLSVLLVLLFASCSKDQCEQYEVVVESNIQNAQNKCDGYANSYPAMKVLSRKDLGCLLEDELKIAKASSEKVVKSQICNGVTATSQTVIRKK